MLIRPFSILAVFLTMFTAACMEPELVQTGNFIDSPVQGLAYETDTQSGITDAEGGFLYLEGETITFFIGDISFPAVVASSVVTPLTLADSRDTNAPMVVNIARFLQTLDIDGNPENGISLPDTPGLGDGISIDFTQPVETFENDATLLSFLGSAGGGSTTLVSASAAIAHLEREIPQVLQIVAGATFTCELSQALDGREVECFGGYFGASEIPQLDDPQSLIKVNGQEVCVKTSQDLICWGSDVNLDENLQNPRDAVYADELSMQCILDDDGLQCTEDTGIAVPELYSPQDISAGYAHICALDNSAPASLHCWGSNDYGQLNVPVLNNPFAISSGSYHSCALHDGGISCWGDNSEGQLNVPALVNPYQVSAGSFHTCALDENGVHCWGANNSAQLNVPSVVNPTAVTAGGYHSCVIDQLGRVCWGDNSYGQIDPDYVPPAYQVGGYALGIEQGSVTLSINRSEEIIVSADGGFVFPTALPDRANATVEILASPLGVDCGFMFGSDGKYSQSVEVTASHYSSDRIRLACFVPGEVQEVVFAGEVDACQLRSTLYGNRVYCWGSLSAMQPGETQAAYDLINPIDIDASLASTSEEILVCALDEGNVVCWGPQGRSNLDNWQSAPVLNNPTKIALDASYSAQGICALDDDGLKCWGVLGTGLDEVPQLSNVTEFEVFSGTACAIADEGIRCWGASAATLSLPELSNPHGLITYNNAFCAFDDLGYHCWDTDITTVQGATSASWSCAIIAGEVVCESVQGLADVPPPMVTNATNLQTRGEFGCVVENSNTLKCWNYQGEVEELAYTNLHQYSLSWRDLYVMCSLSDSGTQCFESRSPFGFNNPLASPVLVDPVSIAVYGDYTCAVDVVGMSCWSSSNYPEVDPEHPVLAEMPSFTNPNTIVAGLGGAFCAEDDVGIQCWPEENFRLSSQIPAGMEFDSLALNLSALCGISEGVLNCWPSFDSEALLGWPTSTDTALKVSLGSLVGCVIYRNETQLENRVECWGDNYRGGLDVPSLNNPTDISAAYGHVCAIDDSGVVCWGGKSYKYDELPALINPISVFETDKVCALDDVGIWCWDDSPHDSLQPLVLAPDKLWTDVNGLFCYEKDKTIVCGDRADSDLNSVSPPNH